MFVHMFVGVRKPALALTLVVTALTGSIAFLGLGGTRAGAGARAFGST
jgi:hypothetical protein